MDGSFQVGLLQTVEVEIVAASRAATSQGQGHGKLYCPGGKFVLAYDIYQTEKKKKKECAV